jgi:hypothetical protein
MTVYYDRYNRDTKKWKSLKFVPGRVVQLPELNEMQSVAHDNVKALGDILFKDGSIVEGLQLIPHPSNPNDRIITAGRLYAYGYIIDVPQATVTLQNLSDEKIAVKLTETIVTELEDGDLTDPVAGARNQGLPGAHRLTYVPSMVVLPPEPNADNVFVLHAMRFGELVTNNIPPQFDELNQTLAKRTYEESGSYLVNGMGTRVEDSTLDYVLLFRGTNLDELGATIGLVRLPAESDQAYAQRIVDESVTVNVEAGLAYVSGFRIEKPSQTKILIPKAKDERNVNGAIESLPLSHTPGASYDVYLDDLPVSTLEEVTAYVRKTFPNVVRSTITSSDFIPTAGPVIGAPVSVQYTDISLVTHTYTLGIHYTFSSNTITWLNATSPNSDPTAPGGSTPAHPNLAAVPQGASYSVVLDYNATLNIGTGPSDDVYLLDGPTGTVRLTGKIGGVNVQYTPNGVVSIDYKWYLNRADLIYMDKNGRIEAILGQSDRTPVVKGTPAGAFGIANISLVANQPASVATVKDVKIRRLTMTELNNLVDRLDKAEYNQAITNLNIQARLGVANSVNLKGIFTDSFVNMDKLDTNHADYLANKIGFNFNEATITPGENTYEEVLSFDAGGSTNFKEGPQFLTSVTTGGVYNTARMRQTAATSTIQINQYSAFTIPPIVMLTPSSDIATANDNVSVRITNGASQVTVSRDSILSEQLNRFSTDTAGRLTISDGPRYARSRQVEVTASGFPAFADNLAVTIDNLAVNATPKPLSTTTVGGTPFNGNTTVKADSQGRVNALFTIPVNTILSGTRAVRLSNGTTAAQTTYVATNVVNTTVDLRPEIVMPVIRIDPVAQTFIFGEQEGGAALVAGVDLFFSAKPTGDTDANRLIVQIRATTAGFPDREKVLAQKIVYPSAVNISADASASTRVLFDDTLVCQRDVEYAVVLMATTNQYHAYKATLGESTVGANPRVISEQAHNGVLLSSANGNTWSADQTSDLKFALLCTDAPSQTVLKFNDVTFPSSVAQLQLLAKQLDVVGSSVTWQYSRDNFVSDINTLDRTGIVSSVGTPTDTFGIRAVINNVGTLVAAQIEKPSITLKGIRKKPSGVYVSKAIQLQQTPTNIKLQMDTQVPAGTTFNLEYGLQDGFGAITWYPTTIFGSPTVTADPGFLTYTYNSGAISTLHTLVRLRVTLTSNVSGPDVISWPRARRLVAIVS